MNESSRAIRAGALIGALGALGLFYAAVVRPWMLHWGATSEEQSRTLPGDLFLPAGESGTTRAITVEVASDALWPWVAQLGQDRGGFYSYELLEDLVGTRMTNADRILPGKQEWHPGDKLWMYPPGVMDDVGGAPLLLHERGHALVFGTHQLGTPTQGPVNGTWAFIVEPLSSGRSRWIVRGRAEGAPPLLASAFTLVVFEPVHFVMERKMLTTVKALAEGNPLTPISDNLQVVLWTATFGLFVAGIVRTFTRERWARQALSVFAAGAVFQLLTLAQPSVWIGLPLVAALVILVFGPRVELKRMGMLRPRTT